MALKKKTRRKITYSILTIIFISCIFVILSNLHKFNFVNDEQKINDNINVQQQLEPPKVEMSIGLVDFDTFNPITTKNEDVISFSKLIYDSLFDYNENMELVTKLVDSYNYNDNVLYIQLLKNVYWHNGEMLTSDDVKFTIDMIKQYGGIYSDFVDNISNVEVIDEYTLKLTILDRTILTEYDLIFPIVCSKYYANEDFEKTDKNMKPVGTGVYKYLEKIDDKHYVFSYNNRSNTKAQIGKIDVYNYATISEAFASVKNKKVDMIFTSLTNYDEYIGKIGYSKEEYIDNTYMFLAVNIGNKYLNNVNVRKAINIGIDKETIFNDVYNGLGYVSQSVIYPHSYLYKNIDENYDIDQAKQILIDAKLNNQVTLNLLVNNTNAKDVKVGELIKLQLEKINVKVSVISKGNSDYMEALKNHSYDLALVNFNITNNINMSMFKDNEFYGVFNFENVEFKNYIANIKNLNSYDERKKSFAQMQLMILEQVPYIGIGFKMNTIIYSSNLLGVTDVRFNNYFINISEFNKKSIDKLN